MNIAQGLSIDQSEVVIPWLITAQQLAKITGSDALTEVKRDYHVTRCSVFGGMAISLGFHFHGGKLREFEFFRHFSMPLADSYSDFQHHLELTFGPPHSTCAGSCGYDQCEWRFGRVTIRHFVLDRFGPEEHVRISLAGGWAGTSLACALLGLPLWVLSYAWLPFAWLGREPAWVQYLVIGGEAGALIAGLLGVTLGVVARRRSAATFDKRLATLGLVVGAVVLASVLLPNLAGLFVTPLGERL